MHKIKTIKRPHRHYQRRE